VAQYGDLADMPPELEWLANITNAKTRRAYKIDVSEFWAFTSGKLGHGVAELVQNIMRRRPSAAGIAARLH